MAKIITKVGIEEDGKIIVHPGEFDEIKPVIFDNGASSDKLFIVKDGDEEHIVLITSEAADGYERYGAIHRIGLINKNCIAVSDYDERHGEKWALIRTFTLDEITDYSYDSIGLIDEDLYLTKKAGRFGVIDKNGSVILPNEFKEIAYESAHNAFTVKLWTSDE